MRSVLPFLEWPLLHQASTWPLLVIPGMSQAQAGTACLGVGNLATEGTVAALATERAQIRRNGTAVQHNVTPANTVVALTPLRVAPGDEHPAVPDDDRDDSTDQD